MSGSFGVLNQKYNTLLALLLNSSSGGGGSINVERGIIQLFVIPFPVLSGGVVFSNTFVTVPIVTMSYESVTGEIIPCAISNVTTTGFTWYIASSSTGKLNWIGIE